MAQDKKTIILDYKSFDPSMLTLSDITHNQNGSVYANFVCNDGLGNDCPLVLQMPKIEMTSYRKKSTEVTNKLLDLKHIFEEMDEQVNKSLKNFIPSSRYYQKYYQKYSDKNYDNVDLSDSNLFDSNE